MVPTGTRPSPLLWQPGDPPLIAWYGDDFTGAAATLEVLAFAGLPGALFLHPPTPEQRAELGDLAVIGLAGTARSESPAWMQEHLPPVYDWLASTGAQLVHYKLCSTLDSSESSGSIGCAAELGHARFGGDVIPCLVAAPWMGRWQCFGQLFARGPDGAVHRLDRHPVMACHPVTPMHEADVARHLARQTRLVTVTLPLDVNADEYDERIDKLSADAPVIVCLDAVDDMDMRQLGALMWSRRHRSPFVLGSQGVQKALVDHWRAIGLLAPEASISPLSDAVTLALSGSVSQGTAQQIRYAGKHGWRLYRLDVVALARDAQPDPAALECAANFAQQALIDDVCPLLYTACGPDDPAVQLIRELAVTLDVPMDTLHRRLGDALGSLLHRLLARTGVRRAIIAGGDSSGRSLKALDAYAIRALAPVSAGLSVYRLMSGNDLDGVEIVLKGGQMGAVDCFEAVRHGRSTG